MIKTTFDSLIELSKDGEWGKSQPFPDSIEMRVIRGTDFEAVRTGKISGLPIRHVPRRVAERKKLRPADLVIETAGGSKDRPTGRTLFIKNHIFGRADLPLICASFSRFIRIKPEVQIDSSYLFWHLQWLYETRRLLKYHTQHTGVARFQWTTFSTQEILELPDPKIQKKVAAILSAYDDLIENNLRRIKILEEMAQTIYREWFVKFRFPGHQKVKMVNSPLGKIPEGWEVKRLGDIAEDMRRGIKPSEVPPDTPYIGLEHLPRKSIALSEWGFAEDVESTKFEFKKGEILFGKIRPYFHKVGFAPVNGICSSDTIVIAEKDRGWYTLLLCCVSSEDFVAHATQTSKGTKMPRADWEVLTKYPIPVPPPSLLSKFNSFMQNNLELIENLIFKNRKLRKTRDLLLPKLISGELDVSELDSTIPEANA